MSAAPESQSYADKWNAVAPDLNKIPVAEEAVRYAATIKPVLSLPREARVLEAGCGAGRLLRALTALGYKNLVGLEISQARLDEVKRLGPASAELVCSPEANFPPDSFDAVISAAVIEHVLNPSEWLSQLARATRRGGIVSIATDTYMWRWLKKLGRYKTIQPIDDAIHPRQLIDWAKRAGLELQVCGGFVNVPSQEYYFAGQLAAVVLRTGKIARSLSRRKGPEVSGSETEIILDATKRFPANPGVNIRGCVWSYECFYWFRKC